MRNRIPILLIILTTQTGFFNLGLIQPTSQVSCAGTMVAGYCWYQGGQSQSCDTACSTHGGCNITGTRNYAGSGGSNANCLAVANALGMPGTTVYVYTTSYIATEAIGCSYSNIPVRGRFEQTTTCSRASAFNWSRACACNN